MKRMTTFLSCFLSSLMSTVRIADAFSCGAWCHRAPATCTLSFIPRRSPIATTCLLSQSNDNEEWSDFAELPEDSMKKKKDSSASPKLGIDLQLDPLTEQEAEDLKAEATELINEKIAQGVDDIRKLRADLQKELLESQKLSQLQSELRTQQESELLMSRIDRLTEDFLSQTELSRKSTKLAAQADQQSSGRGLEYGSWGVLEGGSVVRMQEGGGGALLGSVDAAKKKSVVAATSRKDELVESSTVAAAAAPRENRILIVADESQDALAKALLPAFTDLLQKAIPDVIVQKVKPTATVPLGGDNAQCAILFATSFNDKSGVNSALDRLLRRTMQAGTISLPPSQLVCISTLGTDRTDKLPYSMQNMIGGGKLEKRRQMEETLITTVQQRSQTPLDYTICKFGEKLLQTSGSKTDSSSFQLKPGDVLDGSTDVDTAAHVLLQAVAYQPAARNATLCVSGSLNDYSNDEMWNDLFLQLDGPELLRVDDSTLLGDSSKYQQLVEYMNEWGGMLESGQKLTTPIRVEPSTLAPNPRYEGVKQRGGVRLLFLPTNTGKAYMSRDEERVREKELRGGRATTLTTSKRASNKREGGVEVLVEVTIRDKLRVRARRCNMADDTIVKELSEETILKRLQDSLQVWKKQL